MSSYHVRAAVVREGAELGTGGDIGGSLEPGGAVALELVDNLDAHVAGDGSRVAVELAKGSKEGAADAPLAGGGAAPAVVGPRLERGLHQVASAVGHAGP